MNKSIIFVATTPFAVNAFLLNHLFLLSKIYDITLCVNTTSYPLTGDIAQSIRVVHVDIERKVAPFKDFVALLQLIQCIRKLRPVAVHSITPKAGFLAMLSAWFLGVPLRVHTFTGQVWTNMVGIHRLFFKNIDRLIVLLANHILADSVSQCRYLVDEGIVSSNQIELLGNGSIAGVDITKFQPDLLTRASIRADLGSSEGSLVFIFVGRLVRDKGIFDLVEAFEAVANQHTEWELWIVGPDEDGLQSSLQNRTKYQGLRITWVGPTMNPERFMTAADILVLPSYREGFGSVIIEAAACGVPCIAYRIDGVVDAVVEDITGLLVDIGDISDLAFAMQRLGEAQVLRNKMAVAARHRVISKFSNHDVSEAWLEFYSDNL